MPNKKSACCGKCRKVVQKKVGERLIKIELCSNSACSCHIQPCALAQPECTCPFSKDTAREIGHKLDCPRVAEKTWWQEAQSEEAHKNGLIGTIDNYCCACEYDIIGFKNRTARAIVRERERIIERLEDKIKKIEDSLHGGCGLEDEDEVPCDSCEIIKEIKTILAQEK